MPDINVNQEEIRTTREVARELGSILSDIESGAIEKIVVMSPAGKMRAVVISVDEYTRLASCEAELRTLSACSKQDKS